MNKQISAVDAFTLQSDEAVILLDIREDHELDICRIEGAFHIPMGEIPDRCDTLPRDRPIVVFCHHGMRSAHVQKFLQDKGFDNIINMKGGLHAWSTDVDPRIARY